MERNEMRSLFASLKFTLWRVWEFGDRNDVILYRGQSPLAPGLLSSELRLV
jgi:hypothetical protein